MVPTVGVLTETSMVYVPDDLTRVVDATWSGTDIKTGPFGVVLGRPIGSPSYFEGPE